MTIGDGGKRQAMRSIPRRSLLRKRADFVSVLEAIYAPDRDDVAWAQQAVEVLETTFEASLGIGIHVVAHDADFRAARLLLGYATGVMAVTETG